MYMYMYVRNVFVGPRPGSVGVCVCVGAADQGIQSRNEKPGNAWDEAIHVHLSEDTIYSVVGYIQQLCSWTVQLHFESRVSCPRGMLIRMKTSVKVPGVSEGVLPPDAEPVTSQEALHHLAKQV